MAGALEKIDEILSYLEKLTGHSSFCSGKSKRRFTLGYWEIHGLAQPARLMLVYGGHCNFEDVAYKYGPPPEYHKNNWLDVKYKLDLDFPNLPYLIDHQHDVRITESHAVYRYLARELHIGSTDSQGTGTEEMLGDILKDMFGQWGKLAYGPDFESAKVTYGNNLPQSLKPLEHWLKGTDHPRKWLGGKDLCYVDFILFEFVDATSKLYTHMYESFPELTRFHKEFKALSQLQNYFKKCHYPANAPFANV